MRWGSAKVAVNRFFHTGNWRAGIVLLAAAIFLARAALPMPVMTPLGLSELVICGAHGIETILVDQNMNRVNPDAPSRNEAEHCGSCILVFAPLWAIALLLGLALFTSATPLLPGDAWRQQRNGFTPALPRAPPHFSWI